MDCAVTRRSFAVGAFDLQCDCIGARNSAGSLSGAADELLPCRAGCRRLQRRAARGRWAGSWATLASWSTVRRSWHRRRKRAVGRDEHDAAAAERRGHDERIASGQRGGDFDVGPTGLRHFEPIVTGDGVVSRPARSRPRNGATIGWRYSSGSRPNWGWR